MNGNFGAPRRYWVLEEVSDDLAESAVREIQADATLSETEKQQLIKARIGQGQFRNHLLNYWGKCCCLTGCPVQDVLRASHIKPWSKSDNRERLDKFNGLLLIPNADVLFDLGYISFSDGGELLISPELENGSVDALLVNSASAQIKIEDSHKEYLVYHRTYRFRG